MVGRPDWFNRMVSEVRTVNKESLRLYRTDRMRGRRVSLISTTDNAVTTLEGLPATSTAAPLSASSTNGVPSPPVVLEYDNASTRVVSSNTTVKRTPSQGWTCACAKAMKRSLWIVVDR